MFAIARQMLAQDPEMIIRKIIITIICKEEGKSLINVSNNIVCARMTSRAGLSLWFSVNLLRWFITLADGRKKATFVAAGHVLLKVIYSLGRFFSPSTRIRVPYKVKKKKCFFFSRKYVFILYAYLSAVSESEWEDVGSVLERHFGKAQETMKWHEEVGMKLNTSEKV